VALTNKFQWNIFLFFPNLYKILTPSTPDTLYSPTYQKSMSVVLPGWFMNLLPNQADTAPALGLVLLVKDATTTVNIGIHIVYNYKGQMWSGLIILMVL
jgi:hypothetical protein